MHIPLIRGINLKPYNETADHNHHVVSHHQSIDRCVRVGLYQVKSASCRKQNGLWRRDEVAGYKAQL